jgi:putative ATP-dependent endonuclease of OLD family
VYIKKLEIHNYRGIKELNINFTKGLNILIGHNNVGKTTILKAIDYVLNPNITWWKRNILSEYDFWQCNTDTKIEIEILIGCDKSECFIDEERKCSLFKTGDTENEKLCPMTQYVLTYDNENDGNQFVTVSDIDSCKSPELVLRIKFIAEYNKLEGYAEVTHKILNEIGEERCYLNKPIRQWIGCKYLTSLRNEQMLSLQSNSLLTNLINISDEWKNRLTHKIKEELKPFTDELLEISEIDLNKLFLNAIINLLDSTESDIIFDTADLNVSNIIRNIKMSVVDKVTDFCLPLTNQGSGVQNIITILIALENKRNSDIAGSIILIEELEQNLEPQLQKQTVKLIQDNIFEDNQIILVTHSPYIISSLLDLNGVQKLFRRNDGTIENSQLWNIKIKEKRFIDLRKNAKYESELLESLFNRLVIFWEGETEAGFYPEYMLSKNIYASVWLSGTCGGDGVNLLYPKWFKKAGFDVLLVLDGDKESVLEELYKDNIPFIALPMGLAIEKIIGDKLDQIPRSDLNEILLNSIGWSGKIYGGKYSEIWKDLELLFEKDGYEYLPLDKDEAIKNITNNDELITWKILKVNKERMIFKKLAENIRNKNVSINGIDKILNHLKTILNGSQPLGYYQLDENGRINNYNK